MLGSADSRPDKGNSSKSPSRLGYKENGDFAQMIYQVISCFSSYFDHFEPYPSRVGSHSL